MSYKNTMKLFASNFTLVWKQVLYFLLCFLFFAFCTYEFSKPILQIFKDNNIGFEFESALTSVYTFGANDTFAFTGLIKNILNLIAINFSKIYLNLILVSLFGFLLPFIVLQISYFNLASILYKKLSMNMDVGYIQNLIKTLKFSVPYALMNIIYSLPFWSITILSWELYLVVSSTLVGTFIGIVCISLIFILVKAVKHSFFSNYTGVMVEKECSPLSAFISAFPITLRNFWHIISGSIVFHLTVMVANGFVALFTFFSGLILMIPATFVITAIFYVVIYFNKSGQRYYLSNNFVYNPVKRIVKKDEFADMMFDPEEPIEEQTITSVQSLNKNKSKLKNKK